MQAKRKNKSFLEAQALRYLHDFIRNVWILASPMRLDQPDAGKFVRSNSQEQA